MKRTPLPRMMHYTRVWIVNGEEHSTSQNSEHCISPMFTIHSEWVQNIEILNTWLTSDDLQSCWLERIWSNSHRWFSNNVEFCRPWHEWRLEFWIFFEPVSSGLGYDKYVECGHLVKLVVPCELSKTNKKLRFHENKMQRRE